VDFEGTPINCGDIDLFGSEGRPGGGESGESVSLLSRTPKACALHQFFGSRPSVDSDLRNSTMVDRLRPVQVGRNVITLELEIPMSKRKPMSRILVLVGVLVFTLLSAVPVLAQERQLPRLRVLTYNIHHGQGRDGKFDLERLAKIISELNPDVVALQEVDRKTSRASGIDQAAQLGELTKMHSVFGNAMHYSGGGYGEAILSRFPMEEIKDYRLPFRYGQESRIVIAAKIKPNKGLPELIFAGTHLCHQSDETRTEQAQQINRLFPAQQGVPVILAGDLNARPGSGPMEVLLQDRWVDAIAPHSRIDYVLYRKSDPWQVVDVQIVDERIASDHRPVLAILEWRGDSSSPQKNEAAAPKAESKVTALVSSGKATTPTPHAVQEARSRWVRDQPRDVNSVSLEGARSGDYSFALWVRLEGKNDRFPALASNKEWEGAPMVDLLSQSNMGITLGSGVIPGWVVGLQPNGAWHWNLGNGKSRLDYLPTADRQSVVDGRWHLLAVCRTWLQKSA
jgi:endonuclease/exonuclease/phosphatase family metal-dependent hydrolase